MKYVLEVCLIALSAGNSAPVPAAAQSPALQPGISVELVPTRNATPMPEADSEDAFIVAVTENSSIYLGVNLMTLPELAEKARTTPFKRGQAIYIKADARTPYATVSAVLQATGGVIPQVLLTNQTSPTEATGIVPPQGLSVSVGSTFPAGSVATVLQLFPSPPGRPLLRINNDEISWSALENTLKKHFEKRDDKLVLVKADPRLPFAEVMHAVDSCRATGAKVFLASPGR
jgi:biopolymer transport protein ExbD